DESDHELSLDAEYSTELFDRWRVEQLLAHLERVLRAAAADPSTPLSRFPLLSASDSAELLSTGIGPLDPLRTEPIHRLVAERAAATPDAAAVVFEDTTLSYGELDRRARVLAGHLRRTLGVAHEELVAVALDRGIDAIVAFLGVSLSG